MNKIIPVENDREKPIPEEFKKVMLGLSSREEKKAFAKICDDYEENGNDFILELKRIDNNADRISYVRQQISLLQNA